jgi:hypothetical protein
MANASKRKKPAKKRSAKPRSPARAKRSQPRAARRASKPRDEDSSLVYSDIRRSMHGAILRHLR